ncbi:S-adenosyl-L-methionine-dependent methyltransferase [Mycena belliarum]|uniref:DNA (cytosine-5-)-methyltransferase n=1 Tax=Mycena belliarum TaxID=1033014 RepID=A0AAD6XHB4_9AGAR|nr:S-adenosyl-L-methionine-dependent methyltransferase [Mycena belliae]
MIRTWTLQPPGSRASRSTPEDPVLQTARYLLLSLTSPALTSRLKHPTQICNLFQSTIPDRIVLDQNDTDHIEEDELDEVFAETSGEGTPIRRLRDFTLFRSADLQMISALKLLDSRLSDGVYGASGIVSPVKEENSDSESQEIQSEDDDDYYVHSQRVRFLKVTEFNVHDFRDDELDGNIYIKTELAWYIVEAPSDTYRSLWTPLWVRHRLAHLFIESCLNQPRITYEQFVESLKSPDLDDRLTASAFESDDVMAYITQAAHSVHEAGARIDRVPLFRELTSRPLRTVSSSPSKRGTSSKRVTPSKDSEIYVTPVIGRVVMRHLVGGAQVSVVGAKLEKANRDLVHELHDVLEHHDDPESMRWKMDGKHICGVVMDGVTYKAGDVVAVAPGIDGDDDRNGGELSASLHCVNSYANEVWFCRIQYFFDHPHNKDRGQPQKMFHAQWFTHGSRTFLQEVSHSQELFLLNECDDIAVATIYRRCEVNFLDLNTVEEPDEFDPQARNYFCQYACSRRSGNRTDLHRLLYDETSHDLVTLPDEEECRQLNNRLPAHRPCISCGRREEKKCIETVRVIDDGVAHLGRVYHVGDFVYVKPDIAKKQGFVLFIAQVRDIDPKSKLLRVRYYKRYDDDERRLYQTRRSNRVAVQDLDGICFVQYLDPAEPLGRDSAERWIELHSDNFYLNEKERADGLNGLEKLVHFEQCVECLEDHIQALDACAGGLSQGLGKSGFLRTDWAVERSIPAAETFRLNHPETKVLCADINALLRYAAERQDGKNVAPLRSTDGKVILDEYVPRPGFGPDAVVGGERLAADHRVKALVGPTGTRPVTEDDPRSALPFTMLSIVELYQPRFFLLENVIGLLQHKVTTDQAADGVRMRMAMLKLICRGLIALGYQVRFKPLQAGQWGAPQSRERLIFFGAKRGCKLPEFPVPTHAFHKSANEYKLFLNNDFIPPPRRGQGIDNHIFAPHASITIEDAIGDLPQFDWKNPHNIIAETPADEKEQHAREAQGIRQCNADQAPVGFPNPVPYALPPKTRYQRTMRQNAPMLLAHHVTDRGSDFVQEATTSLPTKLLASTLKLTKDSKQCFGRLDAKGHFKTAMTTVMPRSRGSFVLHPTQKRPISVVEAKRAQGFNDGYILWSDKKNPSAQIKDYYRHVGNAVPVPLAAALGQTLETAVVQTSMRSSRASSPSL